MTKTINFSPVTRMSGLLSITVTLDNNLIISAKARSTMFRGFEWIMKGRQIKDAVYLTQRICGICSLAHGATGSYLLDDLYNNQISENAQYLRNIMYGADFLQNHLRHFYLFELPDYVRMPERPPWLGQNLIDARLNNRDNQRMIDNYYLAVKAAQQSHQLLTIFGGKAPHQHSFVDGGVAVAPTADKINQALSLISEIKKFVSNYMLPDTFLLSRAYHDYFNIGLTPKRIISFGLFRFGKKNEDYLWPAGVMVNQNLEKPVPALIKETIANSFYQKVSINEQNCNEPGYVSEFEPAPDKEEAYSWIKTVQYDHHHFETGPLARAIIRGSYDSKLSTMDRIIARSLETSEIAELIEGWLKKLIPGEPPIHRNQTPVKNCTTTTIDSMRGALLHSAVIEGEKVVKYNIITPTVWNFSPADRFGNPGPVENALVGTKIPNYKNLFTIMGRIIRSYDPCISCGTHVIDKSGNSKGKAVF